MKTLRACFFVLGVLGGTAFAAKPVNFSLVPDVAVHKRTVRIEGFTLSLWGENPQGAFSIGVVNGSTGESLGFSLGVVNYAQQYTGAHFGVVNWCSKDFKGFQGAMVNFSEGSVTGFQCCGFNWAKKLKGVQVGIVNYAETADGVTVQVGLANIIPQTKSWFGEFPQAVAPAMILANWRFR